MEIAELEFVGRSELMRRFIAQHLPQVESQLDQSAQTLSLFEQKTFEIALRLASRPMLILLDEPAAGLSPSEQDELVEILKVLNSSGCALLVIEHSMSVIFQLCKRVLVLRGGVLIGDDAPAALVKNQLVIEAYLGPGVAQLLQ
jgi:ABC-type branched-subunit amino acid transport system ATPase component